MIIRHGLLFTVLFTFGIAGYADELLMKNGSRLVGTLVSASQSELIFDTPFAGEITIKQGNIDVVVTDEDVTLMMQDGRVFRRKRIETRDQEMLMNADDQLPVIFDVADIKLVNPEPWMLGDGYKWFGHINAGLASERGNTDTDELDMDFDTIWRSLEDRFTIRGNWEIDATDGTKSKNLWKLQNKYDRFSLDDTDNYYGFQVALEHDEFADLNLRTTTGPYIGRQYFETQLLTLHAEVGIVHVDEDFDISKNNHYWGSNWEVRMATDIIPETRFYVNADGIVNFEESHTLVVNTTVGITLPIVYGLQTSAEAKFEYDGGAVEDVDELDETYYLKFGYAW